MVLVLAPGEAAQELEQISGCPSSQRGCWAPDPGGQRLLSRRGPQQVLPARPAAREEQWTTGLAKIQGVSEVSCQEPLGGEDGPGAREQEGPRGGRCGE